MSATMMALHAMVVLGAIVVGVRTSGVGIGLWGGVGTALLVFVFGLPLGSPPIDALLIIIAVIVATATMQAAGGTDWMVLVAARVIVARPGSITILAPLVSLVLATLAGTSNIVFSLLPVIEETAWRAKVPAVKPLSMSVVATSIALGASPVSAAMAAMITVMDEADTGWAVTRVLAITYPAALVGTAITALIVERFFSRRHCPDAPTPDAQGGATPQQILEELSAKVTRRGRATALIYLAGVAGIVTLALLPSWRPLTTGDEFASVATLIQLVMLTCAAIIAVVGRPTASSIPTTSIFQGGMVAAIAFFGLAWMLDTFLKAHADTIGQFLASTVDTHPWVMLLAVFAVAVLTTSQSTATRMILPFAFAAGLSTPITVGLWVGALGGIYLLPTNGLQITACELDRTGSTSLGTKLVDNSFFVPSLILTAVTATVGFSWGLLWT